MQSSDGAGSRPVETDAERKRVRSTATISDVRQAGPDHQVLSISGGHATGKHLYRRSPCSDCPWRRDATGIFPAEAFRHSAETAYDMSQHTFACHQAGASKPATCAGFLLRGSAHNLTVRLAYMKGRIQDDISDDGIDLFDDYREMAIANGVDPDDPILRQCR